MKPTKERIAHDEYFNKIDDERLTEYLCPSCATAIKTLKPEDTGDVYDSVAVCPDCSAFHFKSVDHDGKVGTRYLAAATHKQTGE